MIQDLDTRPPSLFLIPVFYCLVALTLFIALIHKQWDLTFLGCMILCMVIAVKAWCRLSLKHVHADLHLSVKRLFPDNTLKVAVRVENAKWLPICVQLRVHIDRRLQTCREIRLLSKSYWLSPHKTTQIQFRLPVRNRGVYSIGPFEIQGGDPLGFFSKGQVSREISEAIVYPRLRQIKTIHLDRHDLFGTPGAKHPVEDPIYLLGTRDYEHRRPAKFIHWKASARLNRLQEKLSEPSTQTKVMLMIDVTPFQSEQAVDLFEETLEVAASMAILLHHRGIAIGIMTNGRTFGNTPGVISVGNGTDHLSSILETMARLEMEAKHPFGNALMAGFGPTAGLSFAHFTHSSGKATQAMERLYRYRKMSGVFFVWAPTDDGATVIRELPPNYHYLSDLSNETTEDNA